MFAERVGVPLFSTGEILHGLLQIPRKTGVLLGR